MNLKRPLIILLVTCLCLPTAAFGDPGATGATAAKGPSLSHLLGATRSQGAETSKVVFVSNNGKTGVEKLTGGPARAHLQNLKAKRAEGFRKAQAELERRGYTQTDDVVVLRSVSLVGGTAISRGDTALVEDYFSNGDGEIVFWSWDDGNPATWEGSIYFCSYSPEADALADAQLDISTSLDSEPIWEETIYHNPPRDPIYQETSRPSATPVTTQIACASDDLVAELVSRGQNPEFALVGNFGRMVKSWAACSLAGCAGAAVACALSGPGWPACFNAWCMGATVSCGVGVALNRLTE